MELRVKVQFGGGPKPPIMEECGLLSMDRTSCWYDSFLMNRGWLLTGSWTCRVAATVGILCDVFCCKIRAADTSEAAKSAGKISGHSYTNSLFGFSLQWPTGWLASIPPKRPAAKDSQTNDDSADFFSHHIILSVAEHPLGAPHNVLLMVIMDDVSPEDRIDSARDVLRFWAGVKPDRPNSPHAGSVTDVQIGGKPFSRQLLSRDGPTPLQQEYYVTLMKPRVLAFLLVTDSDEELNKASKLLDSVHFTDVQQGQIH